MIEISKELLSEVLGVNIDENDIYIKNNYIYYAYCRSDNVWINASSNIYELCHIMKEWVINKGYALRICYVLENDTRELAFVETTLYKSNQYLSDYYDMDGKTEIEAVIKACEWILKEKLVLID